MKDSKTWFREIMSIKIPNLIHKDLSKILLIFYSIKTDGFNKKIKISDLNTFIYRFYIDNPEYAKIHPSVIINSISHYGVKDILSFTKQTLEEWKNDFPNGCLDYTDFEYIIEVNDYDENIKAYTNNIANMLFTKATNKKYAYNDNVDLVNEYDLENINDNPKFVNRILEEMQYCVCCDEINNLKIINLSNNPKYLNNKNNYVTVCNVHYKLYIDKYYGFDNNGYVSVKKTNEQLSNKMHLSNTILNEERKNILRDYDE